MNERSYPGSASLLAQVADVLNKLHAEQPECGYGTLADALQSALCSAGIATVPPVDNPLKAYTVEQLQYEIAFRSDAPAQAALEPTTEEEK